MTLAMMTVTGGGDDTRESPVIDQEMHVAVTTMTRGGWTIPMTRECGNDDNVDDERAWPLPLWQYKEVTRQQW